MAEPLLIGIDLGTTNGKVACYDLDGHLLAEAVQTYPTHFPRYGWYEQDPSDWKVALECGLKEVSVSLGARAGDVVGLAVSNFGPGLVMIDQAGNPLSPCPTWQDERCRSQGRLYSLEVDGERALTAGALYHRPRRTSTLRSACVSATRGAFALARRGIAPS